MAVDGHTAIKRFHLTEIGQLDFIFSFTLGHVYAGAAITGYLLHTKSETEN